MKPSIRNQVLGRDSFCCADCGYDQEAAIKKQLKLGARDRAQAIRWEYEKQHGGWNGKHLLEVDHEHARYFDGQDDLDNLITVCIKCHRARTKHRDMPQIAKSRRIRKKNEEHRRAMRRKGGHDGEEEEAVGEEAAKG